MQLISSVLWLALVAKSLALDGSALGKQNETTESVASRQDLVKRTRFIVEFGEGIDPTTAAQEISAGTNNTLLRVFKSEIFNGASFESTQETPDSLLLMNPVSRAWTSKKITLPPVQNLKTFSAGATAMNYSIHQMTGVDKAHDAGLFGKGAIVGVVDTGVDYLHPALGGGFGPGFKVAGGYDLVGDGTYPYEGDPAPDSDPMDDIGHGTHVSGIIAGKADLFTGVAPEATIMMYKVFSTVDATDEDTLIDAFLMAYDDGCDIITSSVGGTQGWTNGAWALVASRIVEQGVVVTISAGNSGDGGAFAASSGSSGESALAIASVEASVFASPSFMGTFTIDGETTETYMAYTEAKNVYDGSPNDWYSSATKGWPIYPITLNTSITDDACSLPTDLPDLSNFMVLVRRGGCSFDDKAQNLLQFNATWILMYNQDDAPMTIPTVTYATPQVAITTFKAGKAMIDTILAGGNVTVDFSLSPIRNIVGLDNGLNPGLANSFTSMGPTNELYLKPDIAAPGGDIYSTYLDNGYAILSGTSMACPYVAGVAALYVGKFGGRSTHSASFGKGLSMRILASGDPIAWYSGSGAQESPPSGFLASAAQVGSGLVNATKLLSSETALSFSKFQLNDTVHFVGEHSVDITNSGTSPVTYTFSVQDFAGLDTYSTDPTLYATPRVAWFEELMAQPYSMVPGVSFPESITIAPGDMATVNFTFTPPSDVDVSRLPLYSGRILVEGSNGDSLGIPYLGLAADLAGDLNSVFQYPSGWPQIWSTTKNIEMTVKNNFTFNLSTSDYPNLYLRLDYATAELRWDIFDDAWTEDDWKYPPLVGQAGYVGSATFYSGSTFGYFFEETTENKTDLIEFPLTYMPRDLVGNYGTCAWWLGTFVNGSDITPGTYKMRIAALYPFGDRENSSDWDVYETPDLVVLPI